MLHGLERRVRATGERRAERAGGSHDRFAWPAEDCGGCARAGKLAAHAATLDRRRFRIFELPRQHALVYPRHVLVLGVPFDGSAVLRLELRHALLFFKRKVHSAKTFADSVPQRNTVLSVLTRGQSIRSVTSIKRGEVDQPDQVRSPCRRTANREGLSSAKFKWANVSGPRST